MLPRRWQLKKIKDIIVEKPKTGFSPQSRLEPPGIKILNVSCIRYGECNVTKATYVDVDTDVAECLQVKKNDFFVLRGNGNRDYIGIGGIVRDDITEPMIFSDLLFRMRFRNSEVESNFVPYLWQSKSFLHRLQAKAKSGSGLWKIGKRDIENELIALPNMKEQKEIVEIIDAAIISCSTIEKKVSALETVKKSLLHNLLTGKIRIPEGAVHA